MLCDNRGAGCISNLLSAAAGTTACMHVANDPKAGWWLVDAQVHVLGCVWCMCVSCSKRFWWLQTAKFVS